MTDEQTKQTDKKRPCVSFRQRGGCWEIHEDGAGERMRIENSARKIYLTDMNDKDLEILYELIFAIIEFRKLHGTNQ